jgi:hypothetical protein
MVPFLSWPVPPQRRTCVVPVRVPWMVLAPLAVCDPPGLGPHTYCQMLSMLV